MITEQYVQRSVSLNTFTTMRVVSKWDRHGLPKVALVPVRSAELVLIG